MVTTTLVDGAIVAGKRLLDALKEDGFAVDVALWLLNPESGVWRLMMASPVVDVNPGNAYEAVQMLLKRRPDIPLTLRDVTLVSPSSSLIEHLRRGAAHGQVEADMRLFRGAIDGHFIEDAYIYFVH